MSVPTCTACGAQLAPEEFPACFTCSQWQPTTIGDRALQILEQASTALSYWDIQRLMDRQAPLPTRSNSLLVYLSRDPRICWAGKGIYGLFRHGLVPRVRGIGPVAEVHLLAASQCLDLDQLHFVLRHQGYRYQPASLAPALERHIGYGWALHVAPQNFEANRVRREQHLAQLIGFRRRTPTFQIYHQAITARVERALSERSRRLDSQSTHD